MDHFLYFCQRCNIAPRCGLSSAHKQQVTFEYVSHVVLGDPPLNSLIYEG